MVYFISKCNFCVVFGSFETIVFRKRKQGPHHTDISKSSLVTIIERDFSVVLDLLIKEFPLKLLYM